MDRLFTVDEANAMLPRVVSLLEALQASRMQLANVEADLARLHQRAHSNGKDHPDDAFSTLERRRDEAQARMRLELEALNATGCILKDLDTGLVDFPSMRDGRVVYLCWKLGEADIAFWHDIDAGFAGRTPLQ